MKTILRALVALFALALVMTMIAAHKANARDFGQFAQVDPATRDWFKAQRSKTGVSCCDESDGKRISDAEWRAAGDHYEVMIAGKWVRVPDHAVIDGAGPRPPGLYGAVVWIAPATEASANPIIWCFMPGAGI